MVQYDPKAWFGLIFKFHKSDTFRKLLPAILLVGLYAAVVAYLDIELFKIASRATTALHTSLGLVISLLLVFRTNTAYERWWEGRKLWGALVNTSRNLAMKLRGMLPGLKADDPLVQVLIHYPEVLKEHLRGRKTPHAPAGVHQPNHLATQLSVQLNELYRSGNISGEQLILLEQDAAALTDVCGACERIRKTPIPYSYSLFLKKFVFVYVMTMPLGFIHEFGYMVIPAVMFIFYVLVSLELIAEEIEDPFGEDANDLPTDDIAEAIAGNIGEIFAEAG